MYEYSIKKSRLNGNPERYVASVNNSRKMNIEQVVDEIAIPGSILKKPELVAVIHVFFEVLAKNANKGIGFSSEYLQTSVSIKGTFDSDEDKFDKSRHKVKLNFTPGTTMKKMVRDITVEKVKSTVIAPEVDKFIDAATEIVNEKITPNSPAKLMGDRLKIDTTDPAQGIYFKDDKGKETKVALIIYNMPSQLIFMVPALPKGKYTLQVRSMINDTEVRTGDLRASLIVA